MTIHRLWVDDLRDPPDDLWEVARTSNDALMMLIANPYEVVSLDHDLGEDDTTRPIVLHWCEYGGWPDKVLVHSMNPVGRDWLTKMIDYYKP